ncbi:YscQ/HrcQ family type III secretion apparatus protein [Pantoea sp. Bo_7]|uniref:type III secretion system cytoplasmic ring protein SctQ n=1 Tax=unclassified Pantoea TaxID=2630326 RepID=UPI001231A805|nr:MULTISPECIES: type III secretion system cytoplasmic ring protein SctQ [unclassified Pantoea]KAA6043262.1 YscQ/HrcQ family type III secretion apparatus protein [Pantoea sp. Bo_7]KAA6088246.1 YscQ/HrcQ family type III secretion apparatus protein [Pantoea sp. Bo_10]
MNFPPLRKLTAQQRYHDRVVTYWQQQGVKLHDSAPAPDAVLMQSTLHDGTKVSFDLRHWLEQALPEVSQLRIDCLDTATVTSYFTYARPELALTLPGLSETLSGFTACPAPLCYALAVELDGLCYWFDRMPSGCAPADSQPPFLPPSGLAALPFTLRFTLGESQLSARYLRRLKTGDVLLINNEINTIMIDDHEFSRYLHTEEGFTLPEDDAAEPSEEAPPSATFSARKTGAGAVPVTLHFVVHETTLTLDELMALQPGQLFTFADDRQQQVDIYANSVAIATGELIMIDDRLGVEITSVK